MARMELCPGRTAWWRHQRGSKAQAWRGQFARRYGAWAETLDVHHRGRVLVVFSTNEQPQTGQKVQAKKILLTNWLHWEEVRVVSAYAARWQIELFFREMKSDLGLSNYRVRDFRQVQGWVQACGIAFCYLEWYRLRGRASSQRPEWWFRQRTRGLAGQVRQEIEWLDMQQVATEMATEEGRAR
jgi:Transposase DDE domain